MLNYDSLTQRIIFTAIVNVTGDLILQKFILKLVFFLLTHYVPMLIIYIYIYIYMLGLALITLRSLSPYVENSYKDFFGVNYFLIGAEGRIDFPG